MGARVCGWVGVFVRERERERENGNGKAREKPARSERFQYSFGEG